MSILYKLSMLPWYLCTSARHYLFNVTAVRQLLKPHIVVSTVREMHSPTAYRLIGMPRLINVGFMTTEGLGPAAFA
jgi:hypothetical protein